MTQSRPASANDAAKPWRAERDLSTEAAAELINAQFADLAPARVEVFAQGWDNTAFMVNERFVFRFPRRELGAECIESEIAALPTICQRISVPAPNLTHIGRPSESFPWSFAGYPRLPGQTACSLNLSDDQRSAAAGRLGQFLRELHNIAEPDAVSLGAPFDTLGRLEIPKRTQRALTLLEQTNVDWLQESSQLVAFLEGLEADPPAAAGHGGRPKTLVHGDLYVRHLLVDDQGQLLGVIDWGDLHCGDPAVDLGLVYSYLPPAAHPNFFLHYGPIDPSMRRMALLRAVQHTLILIPFAIDTNDSKLLDSTRRSIHWINEVLGSDFNDAP